MGTAVPPLEPLTLGAILAQEADEAEAIAETQDTLHQRLAVIDELRQATLDEESDQDGTTTQNDDDHEMLPVRVQVGDAPAHVLGHVRAEGGRVQNGDLAAFLCTIALVLLDLTGAPTRESA